MSAQTVPVLNRVAREPVAPERSGLTAVVVAGLTALALCLSLLSIMPGHRANAPGLRTSAASTLQVQSASGTTVLSRSGTTTAARNSNAQLRTAGSSHTGYSWCTWSVTAAIFGLGAATIGWLLWVAPGGVAIGGRWIAGWILRLVQRAFGSFSAVYGLIGAYVC